MKANSSFQQILESKIQEIPLFPSRKPADQTLTGLEPKHLSGLFEVLVPRMNISSQVVFPKAYGKSKAASSEKAPRSPLKAEVQKVKSTSNTASHRPRIPGPAHKLGPLQQKSFAFFQSQNSELLVDFTREELKQCYRKLALKLHPDRREGSDQLFIELKTHYENLKKLF